MGRWTIAIALVALLVGFGATVAVAGGDPLPTNGVSVYYQGPGGATARQEEKWQPLTCECNPRNLYVLECTYVRGPALVSTNGSWYCLAPNEILKVCWNPATRAWTLSGWCGCGLGDGIIYSPGGEKSFPPDIPEVSGFDPTDVPPVFPTVPIDIRPPSDK